MFRFAVRNLRANLLRLFATFLAVVVGVGFLGAGFMITDSLKESVTGNVDRRYAGVDLRVTPADAGRDADDEGFNQNPVTPELLDRIAAVPGVGAAVGDLTGEVKVLGRSGKRTDRGTVGRVWLEDDAINPFELDAGVAPRSADEVVLDSGIAARAGVSVGSAATVVTPSGKRTATVVGIASFGGGDTYDDGGSVLVAASASSDWFSASSPGFSEVLVRIADGAAIDQVAAAIQGLSADLRVEPSSTFVERSKEDLSSILVVLGPVLNGFAAVALFVCGFVIFNTFSVVVTQRTRELALARAVAATPGQVRRSIVYEAVCVGFIGSALGVLGGAGLTWGIRWLLAAVWQIRLPGVGLVVTLSTVIVCMVVGTVVTTGASFLPAWRAGRAKPVEALRDTALDQSGTSRVRLFLGGALLIGSVGLLVAQRLVIRNAIVLGLGATVFAVALMVGGPVLVRVVVGGLGAVARRFGLTARLAVENTARNPRRTAVTALSLVVGLQLVTVMTVSGGALKQWTVDQFQDLSGSDFQFVASSGAGLPDPLVARVRGTEGVVTVAPVSVGLAQVAGSVMSDLEEGRSDRIITGADVDTLLASTKLEVVEGDLAGLRQGGMVVVDIDAGGGLMSLGPADERPRAAQVGEVRRYLAPDGTPVDVPIVATIKPGSDALMLSNLVSAETFERLVGAPRPFVMFVRADPSGRDATAERLESTLEEYTGVFFSEGSLIGRLIGSLFDYVIGAVNGLLGVSVIVALIGIVNTLTLSIWERRRELGMVRCLGMTRGQVRRMVVAESVVMALLGTLIGVGSGLFLSWVMVGSLDAVDLALNPEWGRVAAIAAFGLVVGVLASVFPARRAVRLDALDAVRSE